MNRTFILVTSWNFQIQVFGENETRFKLKKEKTKKSQCCIFFTGYLFPANVGRWVGEKLSPITSHDARVSTKITVQLQLPEECQHSILPKNRRFEKRTSAGNDDLEKPARMVNHTAERRLSPLLEKGTRT